MDDLWSIGNHDFVVEMNAHRFSLPSYVTNDNQRCEDVLLKSFPVIYDVLWRLSIEWDLDDMICSEYSMRWQLLQPKTILWKLRS
ncbi:hypothetical protein Tco_0627320 [Tanacetum coccineum]|uniref:Uncharacterized protein n=1 Tax=Tanacetum coccineum TaxID=301880 RepID=A0ABQ4WM97_9ASTR